MQVRGDAFALVEQGGALLVRAGLGESRATAAWFAKPVAMSRSSAVNAARPRSRTRLSTPCTRSEPRSGTTSSGPASSTADPAYRNEGDSSGDVSRSGFPVVNARPESEALNGTARSMMPSALAPTATETRRSAPWPPSGSAMVTISASATSRLRSAMRRSDSTGSSGAAARIPRVIAAVACSHSPRRRAAS